MKEGRCLSRPGCGSRAVLSVPFGFQEQRGNFRVSRCRRKVGRAFSFAALQARDGSGFDEELNDILVSALGRTMQRNVPLWTRPVQFGTVLHKFPDEIDVSSCCRAEKCSVFAEEPVDFLCPLRVCGGDHLSRCHAVPTSSMYERTSSTVRGRRRSRQAR